MIPVVSIFNLISFLIFGGVALKLYFSYKKNQDPKLKNFFLAYLFLTSTFVLLAAPGLVTTNLKIIGLIFSVYPSLNCISFIYLGLIPVKILEWERTKQIFLGGMTLITLSITILDLINWGPAVPYLRAPFVYWEDTRGIATNVIVGAAMGLGLFFVIIFFLVHALKTSNKYVRIRAFLVMGSLGFLMLLGLVNFIFGAPSEEYKTSIIAAFLGVLAGATMLFNVFYKGKSEEESQSSIKKEAKEYPEIQW